MKKFLLLLFAILFLPIHSEASHAAGGEIYYRYIGDSTGWLHEYEFNLILYRREQGIGFGNTQTLDIASSCFTNSSLTLNQVPGRSNANIPLSGECVDTNSSAYEKYTYYHYRGTKILTGICSDYKFSWSQCCRNINITNLASNTNFYFEATLNNTLGPNSSPRFANFGIKSLCVNRKVNWSQKALEPDFDSLFYELAQPLSAANTPIAYAPGYSVQQPLSTINGVQFNSRNGDFIFTPLQPDYSALKVRLTEYRYDTISNIWLTIGSIDRDMQVAILNQCDTSSQYVNFQLPDSISGQVNEISCYEKQLTFTTSARLECNSIAHDGTDFALYNGQGTLLPIISATAVSCQAGHTNEVRISLHDSIRSNDTLQLVTRVGSDFNSLISSCGLIADASDSLQLIVKGCPSVGLTDYTPYEMKLFPNPVKNELQVEISTLVGNSQVSIISLQGQVLQQVAVSPGPNKINTKDLPTGLYLLHLQHSQYQATLKFRKL